MDYSTPQKISDLPKEEQDKIFSMMENSECSCCGSKGLHACIGYKVEWTDEDVKRLEKALSYVFDWKNPEESK